MTGKCNCLTCQFSALVAAEVERRGKLVDTTEIVSTALDLLTSAMHGLSQEQRATVAFSASLSLSARLKEMDAADAGPQPTHQPEARVQ